MGRQQARLGGVKEERDVLWVQERQEGGGRLAWWMSLDSLGVFKGRWPSRAQEAAGNAVRRGSLSAAPGGPWKSRNPRCISWVQGGRHPSVPAGWTVLPCDQQWVVSVGRQEETTLAARPGHSEHQGAVPAS